MSGRTGHRLPHPLPEVSGLPEKLRQKELRPPPQASRGPRAAAAREGGRVTNLYRGTTDWSRPSPIRPESGVRDYPGAFLRAQQFRRGEWEPGIRHFGSITATTLAVTSDGFELTEWRDDGP